MVMKPTIALNHKIAVGSAAETPQLSSLQQLVVRWHPGLHHCFGGGGNL
jgi:hypothetical protein